jgi:urea-proton symporter
MSQTLVLSIITSFGLVMFTAGMLRRYSRGLELFLVAKRSVGLWVGAMGVAATWIWAPSLFLASQKSYQQGLPGIAWFTVPNVLCLVFFAILAKRIRKIFPKGYTLPEFIAYRFDSGTHIIYLFSFLALQICSLAVQLIAGAAMLNTLSGTPYFAGVVILVVVSMSYSLIDGLHTSFRAHVLQLLIIYTGLIALVPAALANGGGFAALEKGIGGFSGQFSSLFDPFVAYSFGITVTIGLLSGPVGDQKFWQRAFAFSEGKVVKGYILGAVLFGIVPIAMSILGFIAAGNPDAAPAVLAGTVQPQQVGPEVIKNLLPGWGIILFVLIVLSGLTSTGDSSLCAGGSLFGVDIYKRYVNPFASDERILRMARLAVIGIAVSAVGIAMIPGITILSLFLFYGTLRSATLMPTLFALYSSRVAGWGLFWGVLLAVAFGIPSFVYGELAGNIHIKVAANIGILLISGACPLLSIFLSGNKNEVPCMR